MLVTFEVEGGGERTPVENEGPAVMAVTAAEDEEELGTGMRLEASLAGSFGDRRGGWRCTRDKEHQLRVLFRVQRKITSVYWCLFDNHTELN